MPAVAPSVTRALQAIKRYAVTPEQIDHAVLAAINVTLYLASGGDNRVSEGFKQGCRGERPRFRPASGGSGAGLTSAGPLKTS